MVHFVKDCGGLSGLLRQEPNTGGLPHGSGSGLLSPIVRKNQTHAWKTTTNRVGTDEQTQPRLRRVYFLTNSQRGLTTSQFGKG